MQIQHVDLFAILTQLKGHVSDQLFLTTAIGQGDSLLTLHCLPLYPVFFWNALVQSVGKGGEDINAVTIGVHDEPRLGDFLSGS